MLDKIEILDTIDVSSLSCDNVSSLDLSFDHSLRCTTQSDFIYLRDMVSNFLLDDNQIWEGNYNMI